MIHSRFVSFSVGATLLLSVSGATATTLGDAAVPAFAAPASVTSVGIVPGAARAEVVIGFVGDVSVVDFALDNGRRIVVDLTGATLGIPSRLYDKVQRAGIANIRFAQFKPEVVRVVVELDAPRAYTVVRGDSDVRLGVDGPTDFEPWQVAQQGGRPTVTAVAVKPTTAEKPASAPALPPRSANNNPRIETPVDPVMNPQGRQATAQPRMNVSFMDADIRDVVVQFADFSGKTIVVGPSVTGTVRASIVDQPWDIALKKILDGYGLAAIEDSTGIITVDSYRNLAALAAVEPLVSKIITVNYAKADAMAATVRSLLGAGCGGSAAAGAPPPDAAGGAAGGAAGEAAAAPAGASAAICSSRGNVVANEQTNAIIVTETAARVADIESYVRDLDVRTPQITIKAKIITVDRTGTEQLGLAYDLGQPNMFSNAISTRPGSTGDGRVNLSGDGFAGVANSQRTFKGNSSLTLIHNMVLGGFNITSFVDALSSVQLTDVQAEPSVTAVDNKQAELFSGSSLSFLLTPPIPAGQIQSVAPQIAQRDIGISLRVTAHVTANRQVLMDVVTEQEVLQSITVAGPNTNKRSSTNQVLVEDGQTAVIGGLTQTQVTRSRSGIPLLMDLPLVGRLFSQAELTERKQDLLILITPHIVDEGDIVRAKKP